ncbi:AAA family ATPase [Candidatus Poribacteria bacterium]|nr:AAA family ATPase [Candidatus Poribacteria bacterium]
MMPFKKPLIDQLNTALDAELVLVASGDGESIMDDVTFFSRRVNTGDVRIKGLIANRLPDGDEFRTTHARTLDQMEVRLLGAIPYEASLERLSVGYLAEHLFAKVIAGEQGLDQTVGTVVVGAMSAHEVLRLPAFRPSNKLVITSGDRSDMILAALESGCVGIVLSNDIVPPPNILSRASVENVPLLLAPQDTFKVAERVDAAEPLLTGDDPKTVDAWQRLAETHVDIDAFRPSAG